MKKTNIVSLAIFILGALVGVLGLYVVTDIIPTQKAKATAQEQQEELDSMVRQGEIAEITADTVKINNGEDRLTMKANEYTTVQVGMTTKSVKGQKTDLTKSFKPGDMVDLLVKEDQVLAIHRSLKPDEN